MPHPKLPLVLDDSNVEILDRHFEIPYEGSNFTVAKDQFYKKVGVKQFLENNCQCSLTYKDIGIFVGPGGSNSNYVHLYVVKNGNVYYYNPGYNGYNKGYFPNLIQHICNKFDSYLERHDLKTVGLVFEHKKKPLLLLNGDAYFNYLAKEKGVENCPTASFELLERVLIDDESKEYTYEETIEIINELGKYVNQGLIKIKDFDTDSTIPLNKDQRKAYNTALGECLDIDDNQYYEKYKPPVGYSIIHNVSGKACYHRSASCVFEITRPKIYTKDNKDVTFDVLMGQDEGTYFACHLTEKVSTLKKAYTSLVPPEIRRKRYTRQGEWFVVPIAKRNLPEQKDILFRFNEINLPVDSPTSNPHKIESNGELGIVDKQGRFYAYAGHLEHDEHATLSWNEWGALYKNTAVKSYSQDGVD